MQLLLNGIRQIVEHIVCKDFALSGFAPSDFAPSNFALTVKLFASSSISTSVDIDQKTINLF